MRSELRRTGFVAEGLRAKFQKARFESRLRFPIRLEPRKVTVLFHEPDRLTADGAPVELGFRASLLRRRLSRQVREPTPQRVAMSNYINEVDTFGRPPMLGIFVGK